MNIKQDHYVNHEELSRLVKQMAEEYPEFVDLEIAGKSREDREIWAVTLTNKKTGSHASKPALFISACIHGGEITGTQSCLYLMNYVLNHYEDDAEVKRLLDKRTLYVLPRTNPDGAERFVMTEWECWGNATIFPYEKYPEGLERCDVDGNGKLLMMRKKNKNGEWKISQKDDRLMIPRLPYEFDGEYYSIYPEGELIGEKVDANAFKVLPKRMQTNMNRNYPCGWNIDTAVREGGPYPLSEPETHTVTNFILAHGNIGAAQDLHTNGGVVMCGNATLSAVDFELFSRFGEMVKETTGYDCIVGQGAFMLPGLKPRKGTFKDWAHDALGIMATTTEQWNMAEVAGVPRNPGNYYPEQYKPEEDELTMLRWNDEHLEGKHFIRWHAFNHPQLGEVEIGGWDWKWTSKNPPIPFLEQETHKISMMCIKQAMMLPEISVTHHSAEKVREGIYRVKITVENVGFFPTYILEAAIQNKVAKPIDIVLDKGENFTLLEGRYGTLIQPMHGRFRMNRNVYFGNPGEGITQRAQTLEWLVACDVPGTQLNFHIDAARAGKADCTVTL